MGLPGYIYTNLAYLTGGSNIAVSTEDSTYTKASLIDYRIDKPFRHTTTSGTITVNLGSALAVNFVWLGKHNLTAVTVTAGTTSACSDYTVSPSPAIIYSQTNIFLKFASQSYQYWKVSSTSSSNVEICELVLGVFVPFSSAFSYGFTKGRAFVNDLHTTEFGGIISYDRYDVRTRRYGWNNQSSTVDGEIETLFTTVSGSYRPFVLVPDIATQFSLFGRLVGDYQSQNVAAGSELYSTGFDFREESPGKYVT
jgi:hypothetical protein